MCDRESHYSGSKFGRETTKTFLKRDFGVFFIKKIYTYCIFAFDVIAQNVFFVDVNQFAVVFQHLLVPACIFKPFFYLENVQMVQLTKTPKKSTHQKVWGKWVFREEWETLEVENVRGNMKNIGSRKTTKTSLKHLYFIRRGRCQWLFSWRINFANVHTFSCTALWKNDYNYYRDKKIVFTPVIRHRNVTHAQNWHREMRSGVPFPIMPSGLL